MGLRHKPRAHVSHLSADVEHRLRKMRREARAAVEADYRARLRLIEGLASAGNLRTDLVRRVKFLEYLRNRRR